jgi:hypothetical protein
MYVRDEFRRLVREHLKSLEHSARLFGGVFIDADDSGFLYVCGVDVVDVGVIFQTHSVGTEREDMLDAKFLLEDLLGLEGIDVVTKRAFVEALHNDNKVYFGS